MAPRRPRLCGGRGAATPGTRAQAGQASTGSRRGHSRRERGLARRGRGSAGTAWSPANRVLSRSPQRPPQALTTGPQVPASLAPPFWNLPPVAGGCRLKPEPQPAAARPHTDPLLGPTLCVPPAFSHTDGKRPTRKTHALRLPGASVGLECSRRPGGVGGTGSASSALSVPQPRPLPRGCVHAPMGPAPAAEGEVESERWSPALRLLAMVTVSPQLTIPSRPIPSLPGISSPVAPAP